MSGHSAIDPELRKTLQSVESVTGSGQHWITPERLVRGLRDASLPSSWEREGRGSPEGHLARVFRREIAYALRVCFLSSAAGSPDRIYAHPLPRVDAQRFRDQRLDVDLLSPSRVLRRFLHPEPGPRPTPMELLTASLSLEVLPQTRIYLAHQLQAEEQPRYAERVCRDLRESAPLPPDIRFFLEQCEALVSYSLGDHQAAHDKYRTATKLGFELALPVEDVAIPALSSFVLSLHGGAPRSQILESAALVSELPGIPETILRLHSRSILEDEHLAKGVRGIDRRSLPSLGSNCEEYLDALA